MNKPCMKKTMVSLGRVVAEPVGSSEEETAKYSHCLFHTRLAGSP
jgi:hypothetical protein